MKTSLNPLTSAIYQTTGLFIDGIRKDDELIGKISRHFYRNHKEDYKAELHNLAVRKK
jgi:hypothetical protein